MGHVLSREEPKIPFVVSDDPHYRQRTGHWPLALMKQAHIHPHPPHSPPPHLVYSPTQRRGKGAEEKEISGERRGAGESKQKRRGGGRKRGDQGHKQERVIVHIPPLSSEEKLRANIKIEKQRYIYELCMHGIIPHYIYTLWYI